MIGKRPPIKKAVFFIALLMLTYIVNTDDKFSLYLKTRITDNFFIDIFF